MLKKEFKSLNWTYHTKDVQDFINKLISWYMVKFEDRYLDTILDDQIQEDRTILKIMNFDTFKDHYTSFEDDLFKRKNITEKQIRFQKDVVIAAGWGLIYDKKSSPEYGYYRAKKLLDDFNTAYHWNLKSTIYQPILMKKYTLEDDEIRQLLNKKEKEKKKTEIKKRKLSRIGSFFKR